MHKSARLTPRGRERIVRQVESEQTPWGRHRSRRRLPADGSQGSLFPAASAAAADAPGRGRKDRTATQPALDRSL